MTTDICGHRQCYISGFDDLLNHERGRGFFLATYNITYQVREYFLFAATFDMSQQHSLLIAWYPYKEPRCIVVGIVLFHTTKATGSRELTVLTLCT